MKTETITMELSILTKSGSIYKFIKTFTGTYDDNCINMAKWGFNLYKFYKGIIGKCVAINSKDITYNYTFNFDSSK